MEATAGDDDRVVGADLIQVVPGGELGHVKLLVVEAEAQDPLPVGHPRGVVADPLFQLFQRGGPAQIQLGQIPGIGKHVLVGVDQAGQHRRPLQVHHLVRHGLGLLVRPAVEELPVPHHNGRAGLALLLHRVDDAVDVRSGC